VAALADTTLKREIRGGLRIHRADIGPLDEGLTNSGEDLVLGI
jgi:hypothetical protein